MNLKQSVAVISNRHRKTDRWAVIYCTNSSLSTRLQSWLKPTKQPLKSGDSALVKDRKQMGVSPIQGFVIPCS